MIDYEYKCNFIPILWYGCYMLRMTKSKTTVNICLIYFPPFLYMCMYLLFPYQVSSFPKLLCHFFLLCYLGIDIEFSILEQVYLCEKLSLVNEMYFAITLDRKTAGPVCSKMSFFSLRLVYL